MELIFIAMPTIALYAATNAIPRQLSGVNKFYEHARLAARYRTIGDKERYGIPN